MQPVVRLFFPSSFLARFFCLLVFFFWLPLCGAQEINGHAFSIKKTFIDHYSLQQGGFTSFENFTGGWELAYHRQIKKKFGISIPFKLSVANVPSELENKRALGMDLLGEFFFFNRKQFINLFLFGGVGGTMEDYKIGNSYVQVPAGAGLNFRLSPFAQFTFKTEYRHAFKADRSNLQYGLGLVFYLGKPEESDASRKKRIDNGDSDGDGVINKLDHCPTLPGPRALNGCPDRDGDGVADLLDRCPDKIGLPIAAGCPDQDRDGVADSQDACPLLPGSYADGCPTAEEVGQALSKYNEFTAKGAANVSPENKEILDLALKNVAFQTAKASLLPSSIEYLDRVAQVLVNYPEYSLQVVGHTDQIGDWYYNLKLSEARAKACYHYLVYKGINPDRISFFGMGESKPIGPNINKEGRRLNRRVEFILVE